MYSEDQSMSKQLIEAGLNLARVTVERHALNVAMGLVNDLSRQLSDGNVKGHGEDLRAIRESINARDFALFEEEQELRFQLSEK
ncbi:hypothetical protein [Citrobacter phage Tr1]|nr:hypothetical protein [Citrobacter phage Tr1]